MSKLEESLLGAMLIDPAAARVACQAVVPGWFSDARNAKAFEVMRAVYGGFGECDLALVDADLVRKGFAQGWAGRLLEGCPGAANVEQYIRELREAWAMRFAADQLKQALAATGFREMQDRIAAAGITLAKGAVAGTPTALAEMDQRIMDAASGVVRTFNMPWPQLGDDTCCLMPGTATVLCGNPGSSKSLAAIQLVQFLEFSGARAAVLELEDGAAFHLRRALAQLAGRSGITNDAWCKHNAEELRAIRSEFSEHLAKLEKSVYSFATGVAPTPEEILSWMSERAAEGCKVIMVDPVTMMERGKQPWLADQALVAGAKQVAEANQVAVVLVSHPRTIPAGAKAAAPTLDDLSGGMAYRRFAHSVLWLSVHAPKSSLVETTMGDCQATHNRTVIAMKARNGRDRGHYALNFSRESLKMEELGRIKTEE